MNSKPSLYRLVNLFVAFSLSLHAFEVFSKISCFLLPCLLKWPQRTLQPSTVFLLWLRIYHKFFFNLQFLFVLIWICVKERWGWVFNKLFLFSCFMIFYNHSVILFGVWSFKLTWWFSKDILCLVEFIDLLNLNISCCFCLFWVAL